MNETITPRLRTDVKLKPFDEFEGDDRVIVAVDDRHFVVSAAVAIVLEESRVHTTLNALAERASARLGFAVTPEMAGDVLSAHVLSVCFHVSEQRAEAQCPVRFRQRLIEAHTIRPLLSLLCWFFTRPAAAALITALAIVELLVAEHAYNTVSQPLSGTQIVCSVALTVLGIIVHELGHLTACARFGATHGGIGLGVYWCMPVFYADVNGAWMLPRLQRAAVDAGGVYLQCAYVLALGAAYLAWNAAPFLEAMVWTHFLMLHTLNPVLKYDGYWLLTDLAGVSNLHEQIRKRAGEAWRAICRKPDAGMPPLQSLALLAGFGFIAAAYFAYVLAMLGIDIGRGASEVARRWAAHESTPFGGWHVIGESALLALLVVMAVSIACLLARALTRIGRDSQS
jgi:putative peptide zinc metalloprotease protein